MKKIYLMVIASLVMTISQAQDITDAVRYSTEELSGTARFRAMSGAFGALGGDLSALNINPAGSAVFLNSAATFTLSHNKRRNNTTYFNGITSGKNSDVNFDQAGAVMVFNSTDPEATWGRFTIGVNYSQTNNFNENFIARGTGNTSIDQYFLGYAQGIPLDLLENASYASLGENYGFGAQQAYLGYQGYVINPVTTNPDNTSYTSALGQGSFDQRFNYAATGLNGKFTFNFASEFKDFLYLGANLNAHFLNFDRSTRLLETNNNQGSETNEVIFNNNLSTTGNGFSLQVGSIAKVTDFLRLGLAYETPTWFIIAEQMSQNIQTYSTEFDEEVIENPGVVNVYPDYRLKIPGKLTGSAAVLFGTTGLISFDYSYKDYTNMELRPEGDPEFMFQNNRIAEDLKAASTYRVGAEYRIKALSLRGGYRIEESPYKIATTIGDLDGYTFGLGYNFGNLKIDLAYDNSNRATNPQLYQVGLTNTAAIDTEMTSLILSLNFGI